MAGDEVLAERSGGRLTLTINRPGQRNALTDAVVDGLLRGLRAAKADAAVRVVVLAGAGDKAFCAGGDISQMGGAVADAFAAHRARAQFADIFREMWTLGKPTVARVQGPALAGGFGLAAACDFVVASEDAVFGLPEAHVGIWPYMVTAPLLHCMSAKQLLRLMLTGERIGAEAGKALGFVSEVVARGELDAAVDRLAASLLRASPQAVALGRTSFYAFLNHDIEPRLRMLEAMLTVNLGMPDAAEGLASFAEKRPPGWRGEG